MSIPEYQKTVFVFGAGASKTSGAPVMEDFLNQSERLYHGDMENQTYLSDLHPKENFELVFEAIDQMQRLPSKCNFNLDNIEHVFGAFDMASMIDKLGQLESSKIAKLPMAAAVLIAHTLERVCRFKRGQTGFMPDGDYRKFMDELKKHSVSEKDGTLFFQNNTFITFNYDVCLDAAIHYHQFKIDYGLRDYTEPAAVKLLKLHGSITWAECLECSTMFSVDLNHYMEKLLNERARQINPPVTDYLLFDGKYHEYKIKDNICNCGNHGRKYKPIIIPPTWNKGNSHRNIHNVWKHAAQALAEAEYIYVIGYSLPATDLFFQHLYALGSESKTRLKKFVVVNPDQDVEPRFKEIISQGRLDFRKECFADSIKKLFS